MKNLQTTAKKYQKYIIETRHALHANPELSKREYHTSAFIKSELDKMGISWRPCGLETGILATIRGEKRKIAQKKTLEKTILLRADMDAIAVEEQTKAPYASRNEGVMHACGHDCHVSMLLTAAHILNDMKKEFSGTVKLAFQPAEEIAAGAKAMLEDGAAESVDGAFAIHIWSDVPAGHIFCPNGPIMAAVDHFEIEVTGQGCHGAQPDLGIDALVAAAEVVRDLQTIVSRRTAPLEPAVVTVGQFHSGTQWNVVAETAYMEGTARCFDEHTWEQIPGLLVEIAEGGAAANGAKAEVKICRNHPPLSNNPAMAALVRTAADKVMGDGAALDMPKTMCGEDFAFFAKAVPAAMTLLGCRNEACGAVWPQHSGKYSVDESVLIKGAMLYAQVVFDFMEN